MIKWRGTVNGKDTVGMCLEAGNMQRLKKGYPVLIRAEDMGLPFDILIDYARTQEDGVERLKKAGVKLPPEAEWKR
jgi:hypothetical protein